MSRCDNCGEILYVCDAVPIGGGRRRVKLEATPDNDNGTWDLRVGFIAYELTAIAAEAKKNAGETLYVDHLDRCAGHKPRPVRVPEAAA